MCQRQCRNGSWGPRRVWWCSGGRTDQFCIRVDLRGLASVVSYRDCPSPSVVCLLRLPLIPFRCGHGVVGLDFDGVTWTSSQKKTVAAARKVLTEMRSKGARVPSIGTDWSGCQTGSTCHGGLRPHMQPNIIGSAASWATLPPDERLRGVWESHRGQTRRGFVPSCRRCGFALPSSGRGGLGPAIAPVSGVGVRFPRNETRS